MKTLHQFLQSRISLRRNVINELEQVYRLYTQRSDVNKRKQEHYRRTAEAIRENIKTLAVEQKQDRKSYATALRRARYQAALNGVLNGL